MNLDKNYDYEILFKSNYKNIPNYVFWSTFITLLIAAVGGGILSFIMEKAVVGVITIVIGAVIAFFAAMLARFITAIKISQKVVVAEALLNSNAGTPAGATAFDELPDL